MRHNDHIDFELYDAVQEALEEGHLDEETDRNAIGVARQVIHQGMGSLSPKQRYLYDQVIVPALARTHEVLRIRAIINSAAD
jgi:hypothetical protein